MNQTGYAQGSRGNAVGGDGEASHTALKKDYETYLTLKSEEIKEQQEARRYYHGAHWTAKQIKTLNDRKQPVVTYNRIGRKINAIVGLNERQRADPKGFPRTPKHEDGAEIATAVLRYVLDEQQWATKSSLVGLAGAVDGIGGIELMLERGDKGDVEVGFEEVDPSGFFYDPRSLKMDFSDARFIGVGKWADIDAIVDVFPDKEEEIRASADEGAELTSNPDSDDKWFSDAGGRKRIRLIDHWYIVKGQWRYCIYTGSLKLDEGPSPYRDEKGRSFCKYIMYSAAVDHEGDRYGFVRNMRSSNDEINQRRSKGLHNVNSRRIIIEKGTAGDVERLRREAARPDGVIEYAPGTTPPVFDDAAKSAELQGQLAFLEDAKSEIENYGFNPALIGTGVDKMSGRAIKLQQEAGVAELGPYLLAFKGWKLRVYRAIWNAVQQHWTAERWVRVTDDDQMAQFFAVNQMQPGPNGPMLVNALGSLDVDIIIDEGPDTITMQQDTYETVSIMAQKGQQVPPALIIELSPLPASVKKKAKEILEQEKQQAMQLQAPAMQLEMQGKQAENEKTQSETMLNIVKAQKEGLPEPGQPQTGMEQSEAAASIRDKLASADLKVAQADKVRVETALKPREMEIQERERQESRTERYDFKNADIHQARQPA